MYGWTGAYICMDGCLYCMDGCLAIIYRVSARYRLIHANFKGPDSFADGLPLHISNSNCITAVNSAPTGLSFTRTGIVYKLSFTSVIFKNATRFSKFLSMQYYIVLASYLMMKICNVEYIKVSYSYSTYKAQLKHNNKLLVKYLHMKRCLLHCTFKSIAIACVQLCAMMQW